MLFRSRLIVVKSSAGEERFDRKLDKQRAELDKDIQALSKKVFICESDAKEEWERFEKAHRKSIFKYSVRINEIKTEKRSRGNPGKNPKPPKVEVTWQVTASVDGTDEKLEQRLRNEEECFVLITNIEKSEISAGDILRQYKEQSIVEVGFKLLKEPALASTIFLKTPERINALVMLLNISLLIRALVQYKIRKNVKESKEELPRIGRDKKKLENPTIKYVLEVLQKSHLVRASKNTYEYGFYDGYQKLQVTTVIKLLDMTIEDFLEV